MVKLRTKATWSKRAWLSSVERVELPLERQLAQKAGVEQGWQALKLGTCPPVTCLSVWLLVPATKQCSLRWIHGRTRLKTFLSAVEMVQRSLRMKRKTFGPRRFASSSTSRSRRSS